MAATLTASLIAHQAGSRRAPAISVVASATRGGADILRWRLRRLGTEASAPSAASLTSAGTLLRMRNDAGDLVIARTPSPDEEDSDFATWTSIGTVHVDSPVAMASRGLETIVLACPGDGKTIEARSSTDDGQTWSSALSIVTEAAAISAVAVAFAPGGDACIFYTADASNNLKRLRRTAGTWATPGTNWTKAALVYSLSGIAACHDGGDYVLCLTGAEPSGAPCAWAVRMGDGGLPANAWSGLTRIAEADAGATLSFSAPSILSAGGDFHVFVTRVESGSVASETTMTMHPLHLAGSDSAWTEPSPVRDASDGGLAFAGIGGGFAWAAAPSEVYSAPAGDETGLGAALTAMEWTLTADSARARFEFDDRAGLLTAEGSRLLPGDTLSIHHGYASGAGGAPEYGVALEFVVTRVARETSDGVRRVMADAEGPWEALRRWRSPDAWQAGAGDYTRDTLFALLTARAGVRAASASPPHAPPPEWSGAGMALALTPGETAATALRRIMLGLGVGAVHDGAGLMIRGLEPDDAASWALGGPGEHPMLRFEADGAPPPGWVRLQGTGRYADAFDGAGDVAGGVTRDPSATTDELAAGHAAAVFREAAMAIPRAQAMLPFHAGIELWDVVTVTSPPHGLDATPMRVIAVGMQYRRGPRGARYDTVLTLGGV